jgi:hypothetical protein
MDQMKPIRVAPWVLAACIAVVGPLANAQTATPPAATPPPVAPAPPAATAPAPPATTTAAAPAAPAAPPPGLWIDGIHLSAQLDAGILGNPSNPSDGLNFGHLFTDHANQVQLNQLLLTANKPLDPKNSDYQWGFKVQFMYGSDARYTQFLGELNRVDPNQRYQLDVVEANALAHLPWLTANGIDLKVGQYPTPLGYETIDPSTNPFYSHSYIFNFGLPLKHTGGLAVTHVNDTLDIYGGIDTGTNTTFGPLGDNNGAIGGIAGFNLTYLGGNLTILALTHFGPEDATRVLSPLGFNANGFWRYYNDAVVTWKVSDALTLVTESNLVRDGFGNTFNPGRPVNAFGVAQYASYTLTDTITLNGRVEYFRDDNNFFVSSFPTNPGPIQAEQGFGPFVHTAPGSNTTYGALTLGFTWKPNVPTPVTGLLIRPEVRWDHAFTNNHPFNAQTDNNAVTLGTDAVITF